MFLTDTFRPSEGDVVEFMSSLHTGEEPLVGKVVATCQDGLAVMTDKKTITLDLPNGTPLLMLYPSFEGSVPRWIFE